MTANWVFDRPGRVTALALLAAAAAAGGVPVAERGTGRPGVCAPAPSRPRAGPDRPARDVRAATPSGFAGAAGSPSGRGLAGVPGLGPGEIHPAFARSGRGGFETPFFAAAAPAAPADAWFGRDKARHFVASFIAAGAVSYAARRKWGVPRGDGLRLGLAVSLSLGAIKEIRDGRTRTGQASWKDLAADAAGAAAGTALLGGW